MSHPSSSSLESSDSAGHKKSSRRKRAPAAHAAAMPVSLSEASAKPRILPYTDIDVSQWREYPEIQTDSLWLFAGREKGQGHQLDYHGNCIPQLLTQLLSRYTKAGDIVLDLFLGSGTTAIEAANLGRKAIGVELQPKMADYVRQKLLEQEKHKETIVITGDSACTKRTAPQIATALEAFDQKQAQFLFLHPPYADIIRFSELSQDLSTLDSTEAFLDGFEAVCRQGYHFLEPGRFAAVVIGDKYANGELIPLGFYCMERMNRVGFRTKSIIVKNISGNEKAKGRMNNLWRYRALAGGFYVFKHEYIFVFEKPKSTRLRGKKL
jgi:DNA modification methylase